jgi:hypothetical protein
MLTKIFDDGGAEIAEIEISERQAGVLEHGDQIVVIYHTPQLLRHVLGEQAGSFELHKRGQFVIAKDVDGIKRYAGLQDAIKHARERP